MLDFSWSEFMVVILVAVLAVGPKQLPEVLHGLGKLFRRLQYMRYAMSKQFEDFMDQADLQELRNQTNKMAQDFKPDLFDEEMADEDYMTMTTKPGAEKEIHAPELPDTVKKDEVS